MSALKDTLEKWFSAVAFAEANEHQTAMRIAEIPTEAPAFQGSFAFTFKKIFAAAALAEEGLHEAAIDMADKRPSFAETVGLKGVRLWKAHAHVGGESFLENLGLGKAKTKLVVVSI